jgi:hypothetical protein
MAFSTYRAYRRRCLRFPTCFAMSSDRSRSRAYSTWSMIVAILMLSTLVFVLNIRMRRLERQIVELVRRLALSAEDTKGGRKHAVGEVHGKTSQPSE